MADIRPPHRRDDRSVRAPNVLNAGVDKFPAWFFDDVPVTCGRGVSSVAIAEFVMAAVLGFFLFGETQAWNALAAFAMILSGVWLARQGGGRKA